MTTVADTITRESTGRGIPLFPGEPRTLAELFQQAMKKHDRLNALNYKKDGEWRAISSREMIDRAQAIQQGLYSLGLRQGEKAAIFAANSPEWTLVDAGCQFAGVVDVPIYTTLGADSICYILNDSAAKVLFIENKAAFGRIVEVLPECLSLERIVFFDSPEADIENAISLAELEQTGRDRLKVGSTDDSRRSILPTDVATLIYTSGTTGEPKGVMLTHNNIISNVIDAGEKYTFSRDDVPLSVLPLSHIFERSAMYLYILNGMAVHYAESVEKVPENLSEVRPTIFVGVPRIFEKVYAKAKLKAAQTGGLKERIFDWAMGKATEYALANESGTPISFALSVEHELANRLVFAKLKQFFGGNLRSCICGGAALPDDIYLMFTGAGISIVQGYGLTETSPAITSNNPAESRLGSVGKPIRNTEVRIAEDGEIEASGPGVMLGYYKKEKANSEAFTADGWFRTGDIGRLDDDGFLYITDRKKELFKTSGGKYIAPSPIEQMIRSSRFVNQVVLIGDERRFAAALIVPNFEQLESYAQIKGLELSTAKEFCEDPKIIDLIERQVAAATAKLARYETVKKVVLLENELTVEGGELTPTLKIKRRIVSEKYKDLIEKIYADSDK